MLLNESCNYHQWVRTPVEIWDEVKWLPTPQLDGTGKYKSFEDVYGREPTDDDRPGKIS